jgi:hypothetical protein
MLPPTALSVDGAPPWSRCGWNSFALASATIAVGLAGRDEGRVLERARVAISSSYAVQELTSCQVRVRPFPMHVHAWLGAIC